jgi:hypothetical protein
MKLTGRQCVSLATIPKRIWKSEKEKEMPIAPNKVCVSIFPSEVDITCWWPRPVCL